MAAPRPALLLTTDGVREYRRRIGETFQLDPKVPITLKGRHLLLEFNLGSVKDVFKDCGFNALATAVDKEALEKPEIFQSLIYRALQTHQPDLTEEEVGKLVTFRHFPYIRQCLQDAMDMFLPDWSDLVQDEKGEDAPPSDEDPTKSPIANG